jgi:zinc transport system substrate-binding protein
MLNHIYFFLYFLFGLSISARANVPNVVVTIKPIHSLVAGVMADLKSPTLLMSGEKSPHTQHLKPSEVRQINAAQVVIWVGPSYESALQRIIETPKNGQHIITLQDKKGMKLYPMRQGGLWGTHTHEHHECDSSDHDHDHNEQDIDGHLWLDPENAKAIVRVIADELSALDPEHQTDYQTNAQNVIGRLDDLDRDLKEVLMPVREKPYVVYHDGTQYFDRHFRTRGIGVLIGDSHYGINAQHFLQISEYIRAQKVNCVFTEPQFPTDIINSLMDKTEIRIETLDYLGVGLEADDDAYFLMMRNLAKSFLKGLGGP